MDSFLGPSKDCSPETPAGDDAAGRAAPREPGGESHDAMRTDPEVSHHGIARAGSGGGMVAWTPHGATETGLTANAEEGSDRPDGPAAPSIRTPESAHLIERAVDRLLRTGGLENSAANLLKGGMSPPPNELPGPLRSDAGVDGDGPLPPQIDLVALERAGMMGLSRTRTRISEEFRLAQRQLLTTAFAGQNTEPGFNNLVMVTSARAGEGKSFIALNLAGSISRRGDHPVLLVDVDSKRDSISDLLGLAEAPGLLDLVSNPKLDVGACIVKTPLEGLSILPIGRERERSPELFSSKEMVRLIQAMARRYADHLMILDAPPCLVTSDPALLAPLVGQIVMIVEADRTQREDLEAAFELVEECPRLLTLLNKQRTGSRLNFGAYAPYYSS